MPLARLVLISLAACIAGCSTPDYRYQMHQIPEGQDLVRLTVEIERRAGQDTPYERLATPTILYRRGEAASILLEQTDRTIEVRVLPDAEPQKVEVLMNGRPVRQGAPLFPPKEPQKTG